MRSMMKHVRLSTVRPTWYPVFFCRFVRSYSSCRNRGRRRAWPEIKSMNIFQFVLQHTSRVALCEDAWKCAQSWRSSRSGRYYLLFYVCLTILCGRTGPKTLVHSIGASNQRCTPQSSSQCAIKALHCVSAPHICSAAPQQHSYFLHASREPVGAHT